MRRDLELPHEIVQRTEELGERWVAGRLRWAQPSHLIAAWQGRTGNASVRSCCTPTCHVTRSELAMMRYQRPSETIKGDRTCHVTRSELATLPHLAQHGMHSRTGARAGAHAPPTLAALAALAAAMALACRRAGQKTVDDRKVAGRELDRHRFGERRPKLEDARRSPTTTTATTTYARAAAVARSQRVTRW